jgi:hypothetical protein
MPLFEGFAEWRSNLAKLRSTSEVRGIEWIFDLTIYFLTIFAPSVWIQIYFGKRRAGTSFIDGYVIVITIILVCLLVWPDHVPRFIAILAGYLLATNVIILLNVLFLTKLSFIGPVTSDERSLLLFFLNVFQVVLTFAIFYRCKLSISASKAIFQTLSVFGTIGSPQQGADRIVGVQIAVDFLLLAVFLAFFVGNLGRGRPDKGQAS